MCCLAVFILALWRILNVTMDIHTPHRVFGQRVHVGGRNLARLAIIQHEGVVETPVQPTTIALATGVLFCARAALGVSTNRVAVMVAPRIHNVQRVRSTITARATLVYTHAHRTTSVLEKAWSGLSHVPRVSTTHILWVRAAAPRARHAPWERSSSQTAPPPATSSAATARATCTCHPTGWAPLYRSVCASLGPTAATRQAAERAQFV